MKKRLLCLFLAIALLLPAVPAVSAEDAFTDCTIQIIFGSALVDAPVKRASDGTFYAPISWISYYGPNMVKTEVETSIPPVAGFLNDPGIELPQVQVFYLLEQYDEKNFARRICIDTKTGQFRICYYADLDLQARLVANAGDYGTWSQQVSLLLATFQKEKLDAYFQQKGTQVKRASENYIVLNEGYFTQIVEMDGDYWVPMAELLPLMEVESSVTGNGQYLCMEPVQDSFMRFLYRNWDDLEGLLFDSSQIAGKGALVASSYLITTFTGNLSQLDFVNDSGTIEAYKELFTDYLVDNEAYLSAFDSQEDADTAYIREVADAAPGMKTVFNAILDGLKSTYKKIVLLDSADIPEPYKSSLRDGSTTTAILDTMVCLAQYADVYTNQIDDHRRMLDAAYGDAPNDWPSTKAAGEVSQLYGEDAEKSDALFWSTATDIAYGMVNDVVFTLSLGPWYTFINVVKLFAGKDYQYVVENSRIELVDNTVQHSFHVFEETIYKQNLKTDQVDDARLCLMMALLSSRHAYTTYWGEARQADVEKIDEVLAQLYTAGRWKTMDTADAWQLLVPEMEKELEKMQISGTSASVYKLLFEPVDTKYFSEGNFLKHETYYNGTYADMTISFNLGTDWSDEPCFTYLRIAPNGAELPIAYGLTTLSTRGQFQTNMEDLLSWQNRSALSPEESVYGWMSGSEGRFCQTSCLWYMNGRIYRMTLNTDNEDQNAPVHILEFTIEY